MKGIGGGMGGSTIKTIQPPLSRSSGARHVRKRRRHSSSHTPCQLSHPETKIIALGTVVTLIVGYTFVRFLLLPFALWVQQRSVDSMGGLQDTLENDPRNRLFQLPNRVENVELWVAPTNIKMMRDYDTLMEQELRQHMLQQCLPSEKIQCRRSGPQSTETSTMERIAILRPPGRLGRIMEDYLTNYILEKSSTDEDDSKMTIIAQPNHEITTTIDHDWTSYTKMIRPVVMPILLEVFDLVIQTTTNTATIIDDDPHSLVDFITIPDIITTLRILLQYHCYVGQLATASSSHLHLPTLTVSLHQLMTYPQEVNDALMEFLTLDHHHHSKLDHQQTARMELYATTIFQLYDTATLLLQQLVTKYDTFRTTATTTTTTTNEPAPSFYDLIKSAIREELNHGYCNGDLQTSSTISASSFASKPTLHRFQFDDTLTSTTDGRIVTRMTSSRSTEMIRSMLVENSLVQICQQSPQTRFCHL